MMPVMALTAMLALSGAAIAVDLARASALRQQIQLAADAAALAAAVNLPDLEAARAAVYRYVARNMPDHPGIITADGIEFGHWNADSRTIERDEVKPSAVRVTPALTAAKGNAISTLFAGVFGSDELDVASSAVAGKRAAMCILSLEPVEADAFGMDIAANIEALNCTVQVNSRDTYAFRVLLGSEFLASGLCVAGGAYVSLLGRVTPEPTLGCPPQPDPLAELKAPEIDACDFEDTVLTGFHGTLQPGVYCGGLAVGDESDVELAAGVYVIKDGPFVIGEGSVVAGEGVAFYLTGETALIDFHDDSELSLTAPSSGELQGVLVFQDRAFGGQHVWDSNAPTTLHGTIYLPSGKLRSGSSNAITPVGSCNVLIAKSLRFAYRSAVSIDLGRKDCKDYLPAPVLGTVALLD